MHSDEELICAPSAIFYATVSRGGKNQMCRRVRDLCVSEYSDYSNLEKFSEYIRIFGTLSEYLVCQHTVEKRFIFRKKSDTDRDPAGAPGTRVRGT